MILIIFSQILMSIGEKFLKDLNDSIQRNLYCVTHPFPKALFLSTNQRMFF